MTTRTVTAYVPAACAADGGAYADYDALGDFEPTPAATGHFLAAAGAALPEIDPAARALFVQASEDQEGSAAPTLWQGTGAVPSAGDVSVLLLPALRSCALSTPVGPRAGSLLAPIGQQQVLVVGGTQGPGGPPAPTFVVRLDTGAVDAVATDLLTPRASATVTAFDGGALVAGGVDPRPGGGVLSTAEVYDAASESFDQQRRIDLSGPRAHHGAVQLADGRTLLVGGVGGDGTTPLASMEIVDPATRSVDSIHVAQLAAPMADPVVLRLAGGEVLVAGVVDDCRGAGPGTSLQWFARDASAPGRERAQCLPQGSARALVALEGGGALVVVAPPAGAPAGFQNAWLVDADGVLSPVAPLAATLTTPVLVGGAQGAPLLWTGSLWLQWQPWAGVFGAPKVLDPMQGPGDVACAPDPGLALGLDDASGMVRALRFDPRGEYSTLPPPALLQSGPAEMAPDRLAVPGTDAFDTTVGGAGGLVLAPGASAFVTDRTYADVAVDVTAPTGEPADVVLRDSVTGDELEVGGASCPAAPGSGAPSSLHVERHGAAVTWSVAGGASGSCPGAVGADARVSVGLRGASTFPRSVSSDLRVRRLGSP